MGKKEELQLISVDDFISMEIHVLRLHNLTTKIQLANPNLVSVTEVNSDSLNLEVPLKSFSEGHHLDIGLEVLKGDKKLVKFECTGRVEIVDTLEEVLSAKIVLIQYSVDIWRRFLELFSDRQAEITAFLNAAKGI